MQEDFAKTGRVGCCKVVGEGSEDDHKRLIMINHDDQGVGLEGPRGSRDRPLNILISQSRILHVSQQVLFYYL